MTPSWHDSVFWAPGKGISGAQNLFEALTVKVNLYKMTRAGPSSGGMVVGQVIALERGDAKVFGLGLLSRACFARAFLFALTFLFWGGLF